MKSVDKELKPKEIKDILIKSAKRTKELEGACKAEGYLDVHQVIQNLE